MRYVALLRAINVGGHVVKMDRLRTLFEELGFTGVRTFIASGNVLFDARSAKPAALENRIERHLEDALGYAVATFLRTPAELSAVAAHAPFPLDHFDASSRFSIGFLKSSLSSAHRRTLGDFSSPQDAFHANGREVYCLSRTRASESPVSGAVLERAFGMPATFRNVTTVRKLAVLAHGART